MTDDAGLHSVNLDGVIVDVEEPRTITTQHGESELAELSVRREEDSDPVTVTLWGKWAETGEYVEAGMDIVVTDAKRNDYDGEEGYATTGDSYVIVEPSFLVNVTDIRSWVQCPRMYYLNKISAIPLNYPVVKGTIVHEVFGDLLRGRDLDDAIEDRIEEVGLELGLLGRDAEGVREDVRGNAAAIDGWLSQGTLTDEDQWRSEQLLISRRFGIKGRADAIRRGMPVELKTGKNTRRDPRFQDKIQAAAYALLLREKGVPADTGTLLYTKNTTLDRSEATGDLSPAKEFSIGKGLCDYVVRERNRLAAMEHGMSVPTGYEADANCESCFEQDTCMVVSGRLNQESKAGQIGRAVPEEEREYFERFYEWLEEERRETHREYAKLWEQAPEERSDDDRALIGLEPTERRELPGGRWELHADRTGTAVSKLREGDVVLASDGDPIEGHSELARIERLDPDRVVVTADEPVSFTRLDVYPSELGVDRMLTALHDTVLKGSQRRKDVLFGRTDPAFGTTDETFIDNNAAQNEAVEKAVTAEDLSLIHGPPGTGKTYTIARAIRAMVDRGERVLLSAFTNRAVDNALEALREQGYEDAVRVGTKSGVREDMQDLRLESRGDPEERAAELEEAQVVAATTATCGSRELREQEFDVALVDEASQLTEPNTLAAINRADRFVLVGDHHQLPPVVRSENGLSTSLFERMHDEHPEASVLLTRQYRMAQRIQAFASREFYDGQLRPATAEIAGRTISDLDGVDVDLLSEPLRKRVTLFDVPGDDGHHTDADEAERVGGVVKEFLAAGVDPGRIAVIAPFRAQVAEIERRTPDDVAVDTVDRFQGSSKDVVLVSFVASGSLDGPIFEDYRRINVALTRAKRSLVLIGDAAALRTDERYARMVEWAEK
ncbi:UvrD/REP helicase [Natranaeroarchaeum sulfidigenes]|uniref:DNA helicase n=1 Tax=Natranaeroarchaeum sulfidigenes TaxID=2784880 RepID=A0A897MR19_9EURY|nr:UvrD/REP helicase [Natranaeroarchaeum sulfidigenes]